MEVQPAPSRAASSSAAAVIPVENYAEPQPPPQYMPYQLVSLAAHHDYYAHVGQNFKLSFKSNEKNVKNPTQVVADDTLHCMPDKAVCVYLGKKIFPLDGVYPRIAAYLKFHGDKKRDSIVATCEKHSTLSPSGQRFIPSNVITSESANAVNLYYDQTLRRAFVIEFDYPSAEEQPSISIAFACKSSCFNRSIFELHVDLVYSDGHIFGAKHLVKVSANPGRDCGTATNTAAVDKFALAKGAFIISAKPRARKHIISGDIEPSPKRTVPEQPVQDDGPELPDNGIYNLTIYGLKDYKALLEQYSMIITQDKYKQMKTCATQAVILNSQIPANAELDNWLEKAHLKKHKITLNSNGIQTMIELHKAYHRHYFEDLSIPADEARVLHSSFIYWQTSYLAARFKKVETPSDD